MQATGDRQKAQDFMRSTLFSWYHADVGEIAVTLGIVESVAYDKFVGNLESNVVAFDRELAPRWLIEQSRDLQRLWLVRH